MSEAMRPSAEAEEGGTTIDVVSDVVCPWCYIGKRRLEAALVDRAEARIRWHPFQLNPDIPAEGVDRRSYLEEKFGGPERAREIYARVGLASERCADTNDRVRLDLGHSHYEPLRIAEQAPVSDAVPRR